MDQDLEEGELLGGSETASGQVGESRVRARTSRVRQRKDHWARDTGDKDPNTHQAHAGYIGSTDNK